MDRVLEIAASTRVLRERRLRALDESRETRAVLGREFLTFRGLAERCAAETGTVVRHMLDSPAAAALAAWCARGRGALGERLAELPGLAPVLASTLRDLRDAGVGPDALPRSHADLAATYREVERAFASLAKEGIFDRVGLFRLALRGARDYVTRRGFARVEVHGATELVGTAGDLLAAIAESVPDGEFRFLQPDYQSTYGESLRARWPWRFAPEAIEVVADPALAPGEELDREVVRVKRAGSPRLELEAVSREVLRLVADEGVAPSDIQIVARSLEPYAPWLAETLGGYGIPFTSSLGTPEIAEPAKRAWLDLARALTRDLPRAPVVRLMAVPELRVSREIAPALAALAERAARMNGVVRGAADWRAALEGDASAERSALASWVERLTRAAADLGSARDFASSARVVAEIGAELFGAESAENARPALEAVAALDAVRAAAGVTSEVTRAELERALEGALLAPSSTRFDEDGGGVRVLDAVQARAVPCRHLFAIGLVHGAWPRPVNEDPFLSDTVREALRERTRRPVPVTRRAEAEDRFLLGLLLSQARERVTLSWYESDSMGRAQAPSALLHELPFVAPRSDVLAGPVAEWDAEPSHFMRPADALADAVCAGETAPAEAIAASLSGGADAFRAGRELVTRTDALADESLPFDGDVGAALALPPELSASALEELGQCPLRALWRRFLSVRALESPGADELEANEIGSFVHAALESVYQALFDEGLLQRGASAATALRRARELLPGILEKVTAGSDRKRVTQRHPTVWAAFLATVTRALADFVARDLEALTAAGVRELQTEQQAKAELTAGERRFAIKGTIDRIAALESGVTRVGDYKTGRSFAKPLSEARIRRGQALQLPLYGRIAASARGDEEIVVEVLTVPLRPERDRDGEREKERARGLKELESLSGPALTQLGDLLGRGLFPIASDEAECRFCDYKIACRIRHPPSRARIEGSDLVRGYFALREKEKK